jgi:hypothetical protein
VDISYVWTREDGSIWPWFIDLFSRRVIGWAVGDRLHRDLALAALRKALVMRRPPEGLIHHSNRGSQGGLNWSSQHFGKGGCDGHSEAAVGSMRAAAIAVTGSHAERATAVLGVNRYGD